MLSRRSNVWRSMAAMERATAEMERWADEMMAEAFNTMTRRERQQVAHTTKDSETKTKNKALAATSNATRDDNFRQVKGDEDEFFEDLPPMMAFGFRRHQQGNKRREMESNARDQRAGRTAANSQQPRNAAVMPAQFQSYTFSQSTVVGADGNPVTSTRRRYEDSSGRLKATHERRMNGQTMRREWQRENADDEGRCDTVYSSDDAEAFEAAWRTTPFGRSSSGTGKDTKKALGGDAD